MNLASSPLWKSGHLYSKNANAISLFFTLILSLFYFFSVYYPITGDIFDFKNMINSINIISNNYSSTNLIHIYNINYYILCVTLSFVSGTPLESLLTFPLQLIPLIFITYSIFKKISFISNQYAVITLLMIIYITRINSLADISWWCHGIGFLLFLLVIDLTIMRFSSPDLISQTSLILILIMISLNFISYKLTYMAVIFLILFQIFTSFLSFLNENSRTNSISFHKIIMICLIIIFTFNKVFLGTFIPLLQIKSDFFSSSSYSMQKLFMGLTAGSFDPLSNFFLKSPIFIALLNASYHLILCVVILIEALLIIRKVYRKECISVAEIAFSSLILTILSIFFIYSILGSADLSYIIFPGLIALYFLYASKYKYIRYFVAFFLIYLIVINIYMAYWISSNDFYRGMNSPIDYDYLSYPTNWCMKYLINSNQTTVSDAFTGGFIAKEYAKNNISYQYFPNILKKDDMNLVLLYNKTSIYNHDDTYFIIINKYIHHLMTDGWDIYKSMENNENILTRNPLLNTIFDSDYIEIYWR